MTRYPIILLDVDETLLNFKEGQTNSLIKLFTEQGLELNETIKAQYDEKNEALWSALERGEIAREQVLAERFTYIFSKYGLVKDGAEMDRIFRGYLQEEAILLDGALELVQQLAKNHELYIVTNGVSTTQYRRLEKAGILPYIKEVFVSEDPGYQKPMGEYFDYVFNRITDFKREQTIIVGDSLGADILGGNQAGIATCWYNPAGLPGNQAIKATYTISKLAQLKEIVQ